MGHSPRPAPPFAPPISAPRRPQTAQVRDFVRETDGCYRLGCSFLDHPDFNQGLRGYLDASGVLAIVLGTRR